LLLLLFNELVDLPNDLISDGDLLKLIVEFLSNGELPNSLLGLKV